MLFVPSIGPIALSQSKWSQRFVRKNYNDLSFYLNHMVQTTCMAKEEFSTLSEAVVEGGFGSVPER